MTTIKALLGITLALAACSKKKDEPKPTPGPGSPTPAATDAAAPSPDGGGAAAAGDDAGAAGPVKVTGGLETPESVLYDADADVYLVANINGKPTDTDDNGFISRVSPDGKITELKWIDGTKPDVKLDAPKGMAIHDGVLWVADISVVRKFDAKTGKAMGEVKIPGGTFVNDVAADHASGNVLVTDTGIDASFKPTGADAIYAIDKAGKVAPHRKGKELGGPNGIALDGDSVITVTFVTGEIVRVPKTGAMQRIKPPAGQLDGVIALGNGELLVSSWDGKTVFRGTLPAQGAPEAAGSAGGSAGSAAATDWVDLKLGIEGPADIGYDTKRKRLLVPHFMGNAVTFHDL